MSKVLGPIHHWLYRKIAFQEELTNQIVETCSALKWGALQADALADDIKPVEMPALESVIDGGNIHGWLQSRIGAAESRFARIVIAALEEDSSREEEILKAAYAFGQTNEIQAKTPQEVYQALTDLLLDGMPCDRVQSLEEASDERVVFIRTEDIHEAPFRALGHSDEIYYAVRSAVTRGMIENSGFMLVSYGDVSHIEKKAKRTGMYAVDLMMDEHDNIHRMLGVVNVLSQQLMEGADVPVDDIKGIISFIRQYADQHHHGKEEKILFPRMVSDLGPIAENLVNHGMLVEHDLGRAHIRDAEEAMENYLKFPRAEHRLQLITGLMGYANLLERHIGKENNVAYTFASERLTGEAKAEVNEKCLAFEKTAESMIARELHLSFLHKMMKKYNVVW